MKRGWDGRQPGDQGGGFQLVSEGVAKTVAAGQPQCQGDTDWERQEDQGQDGQASTGSHPKNLKAGVGKHGTVSSPLKPPRPSWALSLGCIAGSPSSQGRLGPCIPQEIRDPMSDQC